MSELDQWNITLPRDRLSGRSFLLGNKRALSLSLPVASGPTDTLLHPHKWFGAFQYGRKYLEGQVLRSHGVSEQLLSGRQQVGFTQSVTGARREYQIEGTCCIEEFFVPDGIQGLVSTLDGTMQLSVEPEFDMRFYRSLNQAVDGYEIEMLEHGILVSNILPGGVYDDESETFLPDETGAGAVRIYAAVEIIGDETSLRVLPSAQRRRRKMFRKDQQRQRFVREFAPDEAKYDHAPLWNQSTSIVWAPVRFYTRGHAELIYGFGSTRDEALEQLGQIRDQLGELRRQKAEDMADIVDHGRLRSGALDVDRAYVHVLTRLMDALVARNAVAEDTALHRPATMILAGNQYFHDSWKRDENIALGFLLTLGFYDLARDVIYDTWQLQDPASGRLPQRIRAGEEPPYQSSDGTLWALHRLYQYWRCTGDESLLREKMPLVELFFRRSLERVVGGMLPSGRTTHPDYLWETWMDTPHTPRHGFPVEIQMLWISCLRHYRPLLLPLDAELEHRMAEAEAAAWQALQRFQVRGLPADSLDEEGEVRDLITPNPYFCFGVGLDLGPEVERTMREVARRQLAGRQGIRTLAPQDWDRVFSPEFLSNRRNVRGRRMRSLGKYNYHRGVEWNWLSQFFVQAELKYGEADIAYRTYLKPQIEAVLGTAGIGGISELFDFSGTRGPEFQAWSMAGFLEAIQAFAGVRIDVPAKRITIEPQMPSSWTRVGARKWYGAVPFDLEYTNDGRTHSLVISMSEGDPPDANLDISLVVPGRQAADSLSARLDGAPHSLDWTAEPIAGSDKRRVKVSLPARRRIELVLGLKRSPNRFDLTA